MELLLERPPGLGVGARRSVAPATEYDQHRSKQVAPPRFAMRVAVICLLLLSPVLGGCLERAKLPPEAGFGPDPALPEPTKTAIPTVNVSMATGWSGDAAP